MDWRSSPECTELMPPMDDFSNSLSGAVPATCHPEGSPILVPFCMPNHCFSSHFALISPYWQGFEGVLPHAQYQRSKGAMTETLYPYKLFGIRSDAKYSQITWIMWTSTDRREGVFHIMTCYTVNDPNPRNAV